MPAASESEGLYFESSASGTRDASQTRLQISEAAFGLLHERTAPRLFAYLLRVSGERSVAEDLLQETYCRFLLSKLPDMNEARQQSYLFRIATNLLHDRWRRHRDSAMPENLPEPGSGPPQLDRQLELRQAFQQLKVRDRQLLWLAYVEGSNHKEIAEVTGLRHKSVRLLLLRARRRLANLIRPSASKNESSK
jgi:RNA polymerase sigma-70 factor (ECF subfamily)